MGKYMHKFETEAAFQSAYTGEDYIEPWVSYTTDSQVDEHVDYNRSPYFGMGFVFDGAQARLSGNTGTNGIDSSLKMLNCDDECVTRIEPNPYEDTSFAPNQTRWAYGISAAPGLEWVEGTGYGSPGVIRIINAKSIDPEFDVTLVLEMSSNVDYSGSHEWSVTVTTTAHTYQFVFAWLYWLQYEEDDGGYAIEFGYKCYDN